MEADELTRRLGYQRYRAAPPSTVSSDQRHGSRAGVSRAAWRIDLRLTVIKTLVVAVILGVVPVVRLTSDYAHVLKGRLFLRRVEHPRGLVLKSSAEWSVNRTGVFSVTLSRDGAHVSLTRLAWADAEVMAASTMLRCGDETAREDPLGFLSCYLAMEPSAKRQSLATRMGNRNALMTVGRRVLHDTYGEEHGAWAALAVAPGVDLVFMDMTAPTKAVFDEVWEDWTRMVRLIRFTRKGPVDPLFPTSAEAPEPP